MTPAELLLEKIELFENHVENFGVSKSDIDDVKFIVKELKDRVLKEQPKPLRGLEAFDDMYTMG